MDDRRLYMKHALRRLRPYRPFQVNPVESITYMKPDGTKVVLARDMDEILLEAIVYIERLEEKVDELEYIQRIINAAKSDDLVTTYEVTVKEID